jgi:hypothetical protein
MLEFAMYLATITVTMLLSVVASTFSRARCGLFG